MTGTFSYDFQRVVQTDPQTVNLMKAVGLNLLSIRLEPAEVAFTALNLLPTFGAESDATCSYQATEKLASVSANASFKIA